MYVCVHLCFLFSRFRPSFVSSEPQMTPTTSRSIVATPPSQRYSTGALIDEVAKSVADGQTSQPQSGTLPRPPSRSRPIEVCVYVCLLGVCTCM